jgi:timeless
MFLIRVFFFLFPFVIVDNLKDLLRFLRRDDPQTRGVFKQVCKWNTVGKDLIPIIQYCQDDRNLVLNAG